MDIIDSDQFKNLILAFVKTNKIQHCSMLIFFSAQTCFQKEFPQTTPPEEFDKQITAFISNVPFNKVLQMVSTQKKGVNTVIAINRELAYSLRDIFSQLQFDVEMIVPSFALFGDQQPPFNINTAQTIVKHYSSLSKICFPLTAQESTDSKDDQDKFQKKFEDKKETKTRLYLMLGGFFILILVLIYMLFFFRKTPTNHNAQNTTTAPTSVVQKIKPTNTPIPSPTEIVVAKDNIQIRILNGSGIPGQAELISKRLKASGYKKITLGNAPTQESHNASMVVKPATQTFHREEINVIMQSLGIPTVIRESDEIEVDVLITTRKDLPNE